MAKAYVNAVKYQIVADFEINGIVEKHDIIGAVFGQSEGLLGEEMDLRELQKGGRIGRIEVDSQIKNGKTMGVLTVPSSLDSVKTSLLAAAVESVDKVGPCDGSFKIKTIDDTRSSKRDEIKKRAQELLNRLMVEHQPETQELADEIREGIRAGELVPYGDEKLPAGPDIDKQDELVVVEGRADVINLLKHGVKNVIGMDGTNVPKAVAELSQTKKITLFIDGDRGGFINLKNALATVKIENVARAPDGKEVEELVGKEIILALRKTMSVDEALGMADGPSSDYRGRGHPSNRDRGERRERGGRGRGNGRDEGRGGRERGGRDRGRGGRDSGFGRGRDRGGRGMGRDGPGFSPERELEGGYRERDRQENAQSTAPVEMTGPAFSGMASDPVAEAFVPTMKELHNSLRARFVSENGQTLGEVNVRDLLMSMSQYKNAHAVVFDGILTKRLADEAAKNGIRTLVGVKMGKFDAPEGLQLYTVA